MPGHKHSNTEGKGENVKFIHIRYKSNIVTTSQRTEKTNAVLECVYKDDVIYLSDTCGSKFRDYVIRLV